MLSETVRIVPGFRVVVGVVAVCAMSCAIGGCASGDRVDHGALGAEDDDESSEVEVTRDQLPETVRKAMDANLPAGAVVDEIEHDTEEGTYDVEYAVGDDEFEMEIEADGTVEIEEVEE